MPTAPQKGHTSRMVLSAMGDWLMLAPCFLVDSKQPISPTRAPSVQSIGHQQRTAARSPVHSSKQHPAAAAAPRRLTADSTHCHPSNWRTAAGCMQLPDSRPLATLGLQRQQQQQRSASHASTAASSSASMETSKFAGSGLSGSSDAAVPPGAPASSASLRLSSFRAEVLDACALMDQGRKGYISARELKYVFVSCMGFKPSKVSSSKRRENGAC